MFQNGQKVVVVSSGDERRVIKVQAVSGVDAGRYPTVDTTGVTGRDQQVQIVSGGDETRFPKLQGLADARSTADSVISALTPAAWYRNATDVVSSGGFASIWADYASSDVGLALPGVASNYASTPDSNALDQTTTIEIIARIQATSYTSAGGKTIVSKYGVGSVYSYLLYLPSASGTLSFRRSPDGSAGALVTATSAAHSFVDGTAYWVKCNFDASTGDVNFYKANDSETVPVSWTQIGATVSTAATGIFVSTNILTVGTWSTATNDPFSGVIYRAIVKDGIDGTTVFDADFSSQAIGAASFTESSSNAATVTINASGASPAHIGKARDLVQGTGTNQPAYAAGVFTFDGADNWMQATYTANSPRTVFIVLKQVSWSASDMIFSGKTVNSMDLWQNNATPDLDLYAGASDAAIQNTNLPVGTFGIVAAVFNGASSSIRVNNNAKTSGSVGTAGGGGLTLGAVNSGASNYANVAVMELVDIHSALDDADQSSVITALNNALTVF